MNTPKQDERRQITLRLPKDIDKSITEAAKKMGISKNAYILIALDKFTKEQSA